MSTEHSKSDGFRLQMLQGVLPIPAAGLAGTAAAGASEHMALAALLALMAAGFLLLAHLVGLGLMAVFLFKTTPRKRRSIS